MWGGGGKEQRGEEKQINVKVFTKVVKSYRYKIHLKLSTKSN